MVGRAAQMAAIAYQSLFQAMMFLILAGIGILLWGLARLLETEVATNLYYRILNLKK